MKKYIPKLKWIITGCLLLVIGIWLLWYYEIFPPPQLDAPPSWNGITPGQTSREAAVEIMGPPDRVEDARQPGYVVLVYRDRMDSDWRYIELWVDPSDDTVMAVLRTLGRLMSEDKQFLRDFVLAYARPNEVTWTWHPRSRYLIWANKGIALSADATLGSRNWAELQVDEILIFEPLGIRTFRQRHWPWPNFGSGWTHKNLFPEGTHDADTYPEDPYDWEHMPISQP